MGGMRGSTHKRVPVALKLPQLQNLMKRDRAGYQDEFLQQQRNYLSELEIFKLKPSKDSDRFAELVTFMSHVSPCYKEQTKDFAPQLKLLLEQHGPVLQPTVRTKLVQALILLRNRGLLDPAGLLSLFFGLFHCQDKSLRVLLYEHIVADIKNVNEKGRNPKLNKSIQNVVFNMLKDDNGIAAKKSLDIMVELYKKRVWVDTRTVNVIATALVADTPKLACTALNFFLNIDTQMADDDDDEEILAAGSQTLNTHAHSKKTAKRARHVDKQKKVMKKRNQNTQLDQSNSALFPAINLLHDPQGIAEKVLGRLRQSKQRFEVKLLMMNFVSRVVGAHKLLLLPFYSHLQRYVASQQREVTHILAYLVQACHDIVPPDELMPVIKAIAYNFVTERCPGDVMALGINSIREIMRRIPALLEEDGMDVLVPDLAGYSKHQDKSVVIAARGFINFVREIFPSLLKSRDRGRDHDITARPTKYGDVKASEGVDGAELLTLHERGLLQFDGEDSGEAQEHEVQLEPSESASDGGLHGSDVKSGDAHGFGAGQTDDVESVTSMRDDEKEDKTKEDGDEDNDDDDDDNDEEEEEEQEGEEEEREVPQLVPVPGEVAETTIAVPGVDETVKGGKRARERAAARAVAFAADVKRCDGPGPNPADLRKMHVAAKDRVDGQRVLSAEDFEKIRLLKQQAANAARDRQSGRKRKPDEDDDEDDNGDDAANSEAFAVDPQALQGHKKRRRATLEERLESVIRGREKFEQNSHAGGLTNLEKQRKKNFLMVRKGKKVHRKTKLGVKQVMAQKRNGAKTTTKRDRRKKRRT